MGGDYITLHNLEVYALSRTYSKVAWEMYELWDWELRKVIGHQMIRSVDSVGANIAEGYGRFHYADKNKFYYNARGSLIESHHWLELLCERKIMTTNKYTELHELYTTILRKLNGLIKAQKNNIHKNF